MTTRVTGTPALPVLRQVVLLAGDLDDALARTRTFLGLHQGIRETGAMAALGFEHEVLAIDETFLEIVAPLAADSSPGRLLARSGESGYMVVLQVADLAELIDRAATIGLTPIMSERLHGNPISQWHPRDLGTLAEIDEIAGGGHWHFCPALSDTGSTAVVGDLVSATIGVANPADCARRWATLLALDLADGATALRLGDRELRFVPADEAGRGLVQAHFSAAVGTPADGTPADHERTICGVRLTIVDTPIRENP